MINCRGYRDNLIDDFNNGSGIAIKGMSHDYNIDNSIIVMESVSVNIFKFRILTFISNI